MIHFRCEFLFPARIPRLGKRAANIARDDRRVLTQRLQSPRKIDNVKAAVFPIGHGVIGAETIEIDRDVEIGAGEIARETLEMFAPILAQDRAATLSILQRSIVRPRMHFQITATLGTTISPNLPRPPAFEISAAPHRDMFDVRQSKRAIDPTAGAPFRRPNVPVGMIIERNDDKFLRGAANP